MFRVVRLQKRRGRTRLIFVPDVATKATLRSCLSELSQAQEDLCHPLWVHGFRRDRNPWTNAVMHVGREYTVSVDIQDFFDQVTPELVQLAAPNLEVPVYARDLFFPAGAARQGLPTSPVLANIAFAPYDYRIVRYLDQVLGKYGAKNLVYTRYADDLTVSFDADRHLWRQVAKAIVRAITLAISPHFQLAAGKTRFQPAYCGRRKITGLSVGRNEVHPTRRTKRRLRAARHQQQQDQIHGLSAWCRTTFPDGFIDELMRHPGYEEVKSFVTLTLARQRGLGKPKESVFQRRGRRRFAR